MIFNLIWRNICFGSLILALSISIDALGIGSSIGGFSNIYFPILVAIFQLSFLSFGIFIGKKILKNSSIPDKTWNTISGIILILFGIVKFFI